MQNELIFIVFFLFKLVSAGDLKYFSSFKPGPRVVGPESVVKNFVTIANNPGSDLPNEFTICTSLFIEIMTTSQYLFEILKKDGTHWYSLSYDMRKATTTDQLFFCFQTGKWIVHEPLFYYDLSSRNANVCFFLFVWVLYRAFNLYFLVLKANLKILTSW